MELHQLRYFVTVVREGTFTRAAERLYITQPSLSEQVRKLEAELGGPLFERLGRTLALTNAGEALLPHAERVLAEVDLARRQVEEVRGLRRGRVSVGALPSAAVHLLPRYLAEFRRRHPGIDSVLHEDDDSAELEDLVHRGELDLAIVEMPKRRPELASRHLLREPMVLVVPPAHRLSGERSIALAELAQEPFVALAPGHSLRELLERVCGKAGFAPRVSVQAGQLASVLGLVVAGNGITVVPHLAAFADSPPILVRDAHAHRELGVVWRQGHTLAPGAGVLLDMLRPGGDEGNHG